MRTQSTPAVRAVVTYSGLIGLLLVAVVAYWNSLQHGHFGVREVTGRWPKLTGKIVGCAAVAGAMTAMALRSRSGRTR
jgi:hypothetical protein